MHGNHIWSALFLALQPLAHNATAAAAASRPFYFISTLLYCRVLGLYYAFFAVQHGRALLKSDDERGLKWRMVVDVLHHVSAAIYLLLGIWTDVSARHAAWWTAAFMAPVGMLLLSRHRWLTAAAPGFAALLGFAGLIAFMGIRVVYPFVSYEWTRRVSVPELTYTDCVMSTWFVLFGWYYAVDLLRFLLRDQTIIAVLFRVCAACCGVPVTVIPWDDPRAIPAIAGSVCKGEFLEQRLSLPAWAPVRSIESVDGAEWKTAHGDLAAIMSALDVPSFESRCVAHVSALCCDDDTVMDANVISKTCVTIFDQLVFPDAEHDEAFIDLMTEASWEWRREIALRGAGSPAVKAAAVKALLRRIEQASPNGPRSIGLPSMKGGRCDDWSSPSKFSLLLQPFLLSPAINVSDICVTMQRIVVPVCQKLGIVSLHDASPAVLDRLVAIAIGAAHPFPVLERLMEKDLVDPSSGRLLFAKGTQVAVLMNPMRLQAAQAAVEAVLTSSTLPPLPVAFPVFGCGERRCPGADLGRALLRTFLRFAVLSPRFDAELHHRYSGRDNDSSQTPREVFYFLRTMARMLAGAVCDRVRRIAGGADTSKR